MIDTVTFELHKEQFEIVDKSKFDGRNIQRMANRYSVYKKFPTSANIFRKQGLYFPVVTLPKRKDSRKTTETLEVQVSFPKIIYGTNLFEIDETNLDEICSRIVRCL